LSQLGDDDVLEVDGTMRPLPPDHLGSFDFDLIGRFGVLESTTGSTASLPGSALSLAGSSGASLGLLGAAAAGVLFLLFFISTGVRVTSGSLFLLFLGVVGTSSSATKSDGWSWDLVLLQVGATGEDVEMDTSIGVLVTTWEFDGLRGDRTSSALDVYLDAGWVELSTIEPISKVKSDDLMAHEELSTGDVLGKSEREWLPESDDGILNPFGGSWLETDFMDLEPVDLGRIGL